MKIEENISKLFEGLTNENEGEGELPSILTQKKKEDSPSEPETPPTLSGIERRNFSRADILEQKLELKFTSAAQFARQYIENISMGGLFVRTEQKAQMGELIPIEFTVPSKDAPDGTASFQLTAKVCRVAAQGLGLEFTNLSIEHRSVLEKFVQSALPKGLPTQIQKPKASSVDQLERLRLERSIRDEKRANFQKKAAAILVLVILNAFLLRESIETELNLTSIKNESIRVSGNEIRTQMISSIEKSKNNQWVIHLADGTQVEARQDDLTQTQLPAHIQHTIRVLQSAQPRELPRRSKNTRGLSHLR